MKFNKSSINLLMVFAVLAFSVVAMPATPASAYTDGPNNPAAGTNVLTIGTEPWQDPGEITVPGSPYATVTLYHLHLISNYLHGSQYGFAIPADASIEGIEVTINRMASNNNPSISDNSVRLVKGGSIVGENRALADSWPLSLTSVTYGGPTDLWGETWSYADINSDDFGVVLSAIRDNNGNNNRNAIVDFMQISVYYIYTTNTVVECGDGTPVLYGESVLCVATVSRVAGDQTPSGTVNWTADALGSFTPNPCDLVGSDGVSTCSATYTPREVGGGTHTVTAAYSGDSYFLASQATDTVLVNPRPVTVTADPQTKVYGDDDPALTYQYPPDSLVFTDTFTGSLTRDAGEDVGQYPILQGTLALSANYDLTFVGDFLTITPATPICTVTPYNVTYDGTEYTATGECLGVLGEPLAGLDLSGTAHTNAGTYSDTWFFTDVTGNYNDTQGTVEDLISPADATCTVTPYDVTYDGTEHTADGECLGVLGEPLAGLDLSGTAHTDAGTYTDPWFFTNVTGNYNDTQGTVEDLISPADATCTVTPYDVTYDGTEHTAEGECLGALGEPLAGLDLSGTAHTDAGTYTDPWSFTDVTGNYNPTSGSVVDMIGQADATCMVTPYVLEYDRDAHTASGACTGVLAEPLDGLDLTATTHTDIGVYVGDPWTFIDVTGNYLDQAGTVDNEITLRFVTVTADAKSKPIGTVDPELTYQITSGSLLSGDMFSGELTRQPGENIGIYAIQQGTLSLADYYELTFVGADFTITGYIYFFPLSFH